MQSICKSRPQTVPDAVPLGVPSPARDSIRVRFGSVIYHFGLLTRLVASLDGWR